MTQAEGTLFCRKTINVASEFAQSSLNGCCHTAVRGRFYLTASPPHLGVGFMTPFSQK